MQLEGNPFELHTCNNFFKKRCYATKNPQIRNRNFFSAVRNLKKNVAPQLHICTPSITMFCSAVCNFSKKCGFATASPQFRNLHDAVVQTKKDAEI
jgi:hypothetical protein